MNKIISILEYLLAFLILIEYFSIYRYLIPYKVILFIGIVLLLLLIVLSPGKENSFKPILPYLAIYYIGGLLPLINIGAEALINYICHFFVIIPLLLLYLSTTKNELFGEWNYSIVIKIADEIVVLASISLFFWSFGTNLQIIQETGYVPYFWGDDLDIVPTYYFIYFETQETFFMGLGAIRNSGFFCEAPVYNLVLISSLMIETFINPRKSKLKIIILILTILSTITTTGQIIVVLYIIYVLSRKVKKWQLLFLIPFFIIISVITISFLLDEKQETASVSYDSRSDSLEEGLQIGLDNFFFGTGMSSNYEELGNNSIVLLFSEGGIYFLSFYVVSLLGVPFLYFLKWKDKRWLIAIMGFFLAFSFTIAVYNWLTYLFVALSLSNIYANKMLLPDYEKEDDTNL